VPELAGAPLVRIKRPNLSWFEVGLECGHTPPRPLSKIMPEKLRCLGCAEGRPTDREFVEGAIDDANEDELRAYAARIQRQIEARGLVPMLGCAS
jgi:hypothetical protein